MPLPTLAAPIIYGDQTPGPNVTYLGVQEDSATHPGVPLFGAPTVAGDGLSFSPTANFVAQTSGGGVAFTDGKLNATIVANDPSIGFIENILITERGDYTLQGLGTASTQANVGAPVFLTLLELNGVPIAPLAFFSGNLAFTPSGGTHNLVDDAGIGVVWNGSLFVDIQAELLGLGINGRATKILFAMDNSLFALSEATSLAFIAKKDGTVAIEANIPEPSTVMLLGIGLMAMALSRFRRRPSR